MIRAVKTFAYTGITSRFSQISARIFGKISYICAIWPNGPKLILRLPTMIFSRYLPSLLAVAALFTVSCSGRTAAGDNRPEVTVTILPLKYLVHEITGDDFAIEVLVPSGASPETFEPTPKQYIRLNESQMVFATGLIDFENALLARMEHKERLVDLSRGVELMAGSCSHDRAAEARSRAAAAKGLPHGIDPHIWTSPRELRIMALNAYEAIMTQYPDSTKYTATYKALDARLRNLDDTCQAMCEASPTKAFVVYHPALTYFARAYGLEQIAVETDGKEPSARELARLIDRAREAKVTALLYQSQFPRSVVEVVARDIGVECREIDPMAENVEQNILDIARTITGVQ